MDFFKGAWTGYVKKIEEGWKNHIQEKDLVLIAGDISWAKKMEGVLVDLEWIDKLPGKKLLIKGNHDYWWPSQSKMEEKIPSSMRALYQDIYYENQIAIAGTRLWDTKEFHFDNCVEMAHNPRATRKPKDLEHDEKIFSKELQRMEAILKNFPKEAKLRIFMTHYPPISADLKDSKAAKMLEKYQVDCCVFGHLHNVKKGLKLFGEKNGVKYFLTSCDFLDFKPLLIM